MKQYKSYIIVTTPFKHSYNAYLCFQIEIRRLLGDSSNYQPSLNTRGYSFDLGNIGKDKTLALALDDFASSRVSRFRRPSGSFDGTYTTTMAQGKLCKHKTIR